MPVRLLLTKTRRRFARYPQIWRIVLIFLATSITIFTTWQLLLPISRLATVLLADIRLPLTGLFSPPIPLASDRGRTNFLLLGIGGRDHDGPDLTDTIIVASLPSTTPAKNSGGGKIFLVSIPRDLYLDYLPGKINSAYSLGEARKPGAGLTLVKAAVSQVTGLPIHYAVRVDFSAFSQIIDLLGGVDIIVENSFDDYRYPLAGLENASCPADPDLTCRYEHLHFDRGPTHMDGTLALKYVRSRYAAGVEGTDFARSRRQELLLAAVRQKLFTLPNLLSPARMLAIYQNLKTHLITDIPPQQAGSLLSKTTIWKNLPIVPVSLQQYLINPAQDERGWILLPQPGSFEEIHRYLEKQIY